MSLETLDIIVAALISIAPALSAIIGCVASFIKLKKNNEISNKEIVEKFETVRQEVMNTKQYESLKQQLLVAHQENRELKKQINELLTKIDKVVRNEDSDE